jgi:hypothetical protein
MVIAQPTRNPGLEVISTSDLVFYYDFELSSARVVSGTLTNLLNRKTNGTEDLSVVTVSGYPNPITIERSINGQGSIKCNNEGYARLTNATNFHSTSFSLCFKFFATKAATGDTLVQIYNNLSTNRIIMNVAFTVSSSSSSSDLTIKTWNTSGTLTNFVVSTNTFTQNQWYSVVISRSGTNWKIYINGVLLHNLINYNHSTTRDQIMMFAIGFNPVNNADRFFGFIDDFRIYQRAITDEEALTLHTSLA